MSNLKESEILCLKKFKNQSFSLNTGKVKLTLIEAMLFITKNRPIRSVIQARTSVLYKKLIRLEVMF